jgi:hypothetical protein
VLVETRALGTMRAPSAQSQTTAETTRWGRDERWPLETAGSTSELGSPSGYTERHSGQSVAFVLEGFHRVRARSKPSRSAELLFCVAWRPAFTSVAIAIGSGVRPKIIQERLVHSSVRLSLDLDDETRPRFARPPECEVDPQTTTPRPGGRGVCHMERTTRFELATLTLAR